ncbi:hypothetical protein BDN71DRAFT_1457211 [Pleurotus eryngii]|uniref:Uncharacterized protein n=1 Tax=Pleurotus eryngii TaxID=5323 RepID=A0A9P5ZI11_PLEER|nr:hypothetical protein BDN71DRAFT_1457211 [Pleurotus eryngii]
MHVSLLNVVISTVFLSPPPTHNTILERLLEMPSINDSKCVLITGATVGTRPVTSVECEGGGKCSERRNEVVRSWSREVVEEERRERKRRDKAD